MFFFLNIMEVCCLSENQKKSEYSPVYLEYTPYKTDTAKIFLITLNDIPKKAVYPPTSAFFPIDKISLHQYFLLQTIIPQFTQKR